MPIDKSSVLLVMEKPSQLKAIAPLVAARWPGRPVFAVMTFYLGLYEFRYPRGLGFSDLPFVSDPTWKIRDFGWENQCFVVELTNGQYERTELCPFEVVKSGAEIWFGCDPDSSGANGYERLLTECLGLEAAAQERPAMIIQSLDHASLQRTLTEPNSTASPMFRSWANAGDAKRFFDYNFNVNSLAILGDCLRKVGVDTEEFGMSKYALQTLYGLRGVAPLSEGRLIHRMDKWPGTGRYPICELGSPASRSSILAQLKTAGLVTYEGRLVALSDRGHDFLNLLHPDCEDADLPARLEAWKKDWPNSKPKITRYLRTFFGKQLRYKPLVR